MARRDCATALEAPSLYDEFLRYLARWGHAVPRSTCERDWSQAACDPIRACCRCSSASTRTPTAIGASTPCARTWWTWRPQFQLWRFRHMRTVMRIIGFKRGTGGSSGVGFLKQALELTFFPELFEVRTTIDGKPGTPDQGY